MSTETVTQTTQELKLTPPDPVPTVTAQQAMGLVPVTDEQQSKLAQRVEAYVADLIAQDVNSPEFGKRVAARKSWKHRRSRTAFWTSQFAAWTKVQG